MMKWQETDQTAFFGKIEKRYLLPIASLRFLKILIKYRSPGLANPTGLNSKVCGGHISGTGRISWPQPLRSLGVLLFELIFLLSQWQIVFFCRPLTGK